MQERLFVKNLPRNSKTFFNLVAYYFFFKNIENINRMGANDEYILHVKKMF